MTRSFAKSALCASALIALWAPAHAAQIIGGSDLLTPTHAAQMEGWLTGDPQLAYSGPLAFTNIFDKAPGDTSVDFHAAVDGKGPTFFVVEATSVASGNVMQIVGGYNPDSWDSTSNWIERPTVADRIAFIFNLIDGTVMSQGQLNPSGRYTALNNAGYGPVMGAGADIDIGGDLSTGAKWGVGFCVDPTLDCFSVKVTILGVTEATSATGNGRDAAVTYGALEVFTISAATVPVPAAAPLLLGALGLTGWIARRRKG